MSDVNILDYPGLNNTNPQSGVVSLSTLLNNYTAEIAVIPWHIDQVANVLPGNPPQYSTTEYSVYQLPSEISYENSNVPVVRIVIDTTVDLGGKAYRLPPHCVLQLVATGKILNGTLISNDSIVLGLDPQNPPALAAINGYYSIAYVVDSSSGDFDLLGKIFNQDGNEITIRGGVINRGTPLYYTYELFHAVEALNERDNCGINHLGRRARNLGITDCIVGVHMQHFASGSGHSSTELQFCGQFRLASATYTGCGLAYEILANGLSVKMLKFYCGDSSISIEEYCSGVEVFVSELQETLASIGLPLIPAVDISNEKALWTNGPLEYSQQLANLAASLSNPESATHPAWVVEPCVSFAGIKQLSSANSVLHNNVTPLLNTYPTLSFSDEELSDGELTNMVRVLSEMYQADSLVWSGLKFHDIPISETGVRAYNKALRFPENYNIGNYLNFNALVLKLYWQAFEQNVMRCRFPYVNIFYIEEFYDESSQNEYNQNERLERTSGNIERPMHDFFLTFANNQNPQIEIPQKMTFYKPQNAYGIVRYFRFKRPTAVYLEVYAHGHAFQCGTTGNPYGKEEDGLMSTVHSWSSRNGYSLRYEGPTIPTSNNYIPINDRDTEMTHWFFHADIEPFELDIFMLIEADGIAVCADSNKVERIDVVPINVGDVLQHDNFYQLSMCSSIRRSASSSSTTSTFLFNLSLSSTNSLIICSPKMCPFD